MYADSSNPVAFTLGLAENYTVRTRYRRQFLDDRTPAPGDDGWDTLHQALHFQIGDFLTVDLIGIALGYSIGKAINEKAGFRDCVEATVDLWVSMPPTDYKFLKLRGLSGEPVLFAIEALGWRQGSFHLEGVPRCPTAS